MALILFDIDTLTSAYTHSTRTQPNAMLNFGGVLVSLKYTDLTLMAVRYCYYADKGEDHFRLSHDIAL